MFELNANLVLFVFPLCGALDRVIRGRRSRLPMEVALWRAARELPRDYFMAFFPWAALNLLDLPYYSLAGLGVMLLSGVAAIPVLLAFKILRDRTVARR